MNHELQLEERLETWEQDFESYLDLLKSRKFYTDLETIELIKIVYKKIFIYTTITTRIEDIRVRGNLVDFYNECRNNLIISLDLMNFNYISASKQILRSSIESFFRLTLALEQINYYNGRKSRGEYSVDDTLRELKGLQESHKVGKLTSFIVNHFPHTSVGGIYKRLNEIYSILSSSVHVNKKDHFTPHKYLMDYSKLEQEKFNNCLSTIEEVIELIIHALYYFSHLLKENNIYFEKKYIVQFEKSLRYENFLEKIDTELN